MKTGTEKLLRDLKVALEAAEKLLDLAAANSWQQLRDSIRSLLTSSIELLHIRLELVGVEIEQELSRARSLLVWSLALLLLALLAVGFGGMALIIAFWDRHRQFVSALVASVFLLLTLATATLVIHGLRTKPRLFASSLRELRNDIGLLRRER